MYYNWYDEATGEPVLIWPTNGTTVHPFVSSVDSGWLGAALLVVKNSDAVAGPLAAEIFSRMRWDAFYNPGDGMGGHPTTRPGGLMHGGFFVFDHDRPGGVYRGTHIGGGDVWLTTHHYDTIVSETRITSYLGILTGQVPARHYFAPWRTFPATCDWNWHEMQPVGETRTYLGHRRLRGRLHLPRHAHRARLGRKHVRGAHARGLRAGGGLGAAQLGRQPPAPRAGRARARARGGGLRLLGLLAVEQPRRRLPRVRRRRAGDEPRRLLLRPGEHQLRRRASGRAVRPPTRTRTSRRASSRPTPRSSR